MESISYLRSRRDISDGGNFNNNNNSDDYYDDEGPAMSPLFFTLSLLLLVGSICTCVFLYLRRRRLNRRRRQQQHSLLPSHRRSAALHRSCSMAKFPTHANDETIFVYDEKLNLIANSSGPPPSSIPEIHLTFPDEKDASGREQSGRVVVVQVTDSGNVGMAPLSIDVLPPYQQSDADRFHSLDLDRIGGLKEDTRHLQKYC